MTQTKAARLKKHFRKFGAFYLMLVIPMTILILFKYVPMYGAQIAFREFRITRGIEKSPWVGFKYFSKFFSYYHFPAIIRNTLVINLYSLLTFPLAPMFALCLNHMPCRRYTKLVQNVSYLPHFISTVVLCSMVIQFTNARTGLINQFLGLFGVPAVNYMAKKEYFYGIYVWSGVWQNVGWDAIIYIAALAGVSLDLIEAAKIDGANRLQIVLHVNIPHILPTIVTLLILRTGSVLSVGFEKIFLMQTPLNLEDSLPIQRYHFVVFSVFAYCTAADIPSAPGLPAANPFPLRMPPAVRSPQAPPAPAQ